MIFSEEFKADCPDGYQPVLNPVEWRTKDLVGNVNFLTLTFDVPNEVTDVNGLIANLTKQLSDNYEIASACKYAMIRNRRNAFIVGIDERGKEFILNQIKELQTKGSGRWVNVRSDCIWLFQKCSEKPLV
jgi:hypothetical protein